MSGAPVVYSPSPGLQRATRGHLRAEQKSSTKRVVHAPTVLPSALTRSPGWHLPGAGPPGPTQGLGQEGSPAGLVWAKVPRLLSIIPTGKREMRAGPGSSSLGRHIALRTVRVGEGPHDPSWGAFCLGALSQL